MDLVTYALAKKYTEDTVKGAGALKGQDGDSAYQVAVKNGFVGTEQEWLDSLDGPEGKAGISPIVMIEPTSDGNQVTITDATGPKTFEVKNGKDGKDAQFGYEESADTTVELKANVFHVFTSPATTVSVTTAPSTGYAEYSFKFTTASSGGNLSIPAEFAWNGGKAPELKPNTTYQVVLFSGTAYISGGVAV